MRGYAIAVTVYTVASTCAAAWTLKAAYEEAALRELKAASVDNISSAEGEEVDNAHIQSGDDSDTPVINILLESKVSLLLLANLLTSSFMVASLTTKAVFLGKISALESRKLTERLVNYVLFRAVLVGAVVEPDVLEIVIWTTWFTILGYLKIFGGLARDRIDWLTAAPAAKLSARIQMCTLLLLLLVCVVGCGTACCYIFQYAGVSQLLLLLSELMVIGLDLIQTSIKYALHLAETWHVYMVELMQARSQEECIDEGGMAGWWARVHGLWLRALPWGSGDEAVMDPITAWEWRGSFLYHTDFAADIVILIITLVHNAYIWWLHGMAFQLIDAILFLNMKTLAANLQHRFRGYLHYCQATKNLQEAFPNATAEQLVAFNDDCAICKERMSSAKRLPCGHLFHLSCLRSWLEQGTADNYSCPTCRFSLLVNLSGPAAPAASAQPAAAASASPAAAAAAHPPAPGAAPGGQGVFLPPEAQLPMDAGALQQQREPPPPGPAVPGQRAPAGPSSSRAGGGDRGDPSAARGGSTGEAEARAAGAGRGEGGTSRAGVVREEGGVEERRSRGSRERGGSRGGGLGWMLRWLPPPFGHVRRLAAEDLERMTGVVQEVLPNVPREAIVQELQRTWVVEQAVNNLLEQQSMWQSS